MSSYGKLGGKKFSEINNQFHTYPRRGDGAYLGKDGKRKFSASVKGVGPTPDGIYFTTSSKPNWQDKFGRSDKH